MPEVVINLEAVDVETVDVETVDVEDPNEVETKNEFIAVEVSQLKLLFKQCHFCSLNIKSGQFNYKFRGGIFFAKYWCSNCKCYRHWRSTKKPFSQLVTASSMLSGLSFKKILNFFAILQCAIPSINSIYYSAKVIVRPIIKKFYCDQHNNLIQHLRRINRPIHLCMDGQYDSPGYTAHYCTVTAIESCTKKVIGFFTVSRAEANNNSPSAEKIGFRRLLNYLISNNLQIKSVTTDNSSSLNNLFSTEYPHITHYLDMWHILRNLYRKFSPKFKVVIFFIFYLFIISN